MYIDVMQPNQNTTSETSSRDAAMTALAAVGFLALVAFGIYLAVYSARFVPGAISRLDAAAVSLSSIFTPAASSTLAVIPGDTSTTTISFGDGATTTTPVTTPTKPVTIPTQPGSETSGTYPIGGTAPTGGYYGLADLTVSINQVGYLTTNSADSFVAATIVPHGYRPAVKFTVKNIGTNVAGAWRFSATIPTTVGFLYNSNPQQALNPGDSIDFTMGFDQATIGANEPITLKVNYDNAIAESNTGNDTITANVTVQ